MQLREVLRKVPGTPPRKSLTAMSSDEFYDFLLAGGAQDDYYDFLLDFLLVEYLDGRLDEKKFRYFIGLDNPLQIGRFVDKLLREAKMQGSIYEELAKYRDTDARRDDLLTLLLPERKRDAAARRKINSVTELKDLVKDSAEELQKQKQALAQAKMLAAEKQRQEELRQAVILNAPEAGELLSRDTFAAEEAQLEQTAGLLNAEVLKQQKGTVLGQSTAPPPRTHSVVSADTAKMSPGELVAYKKKLLSKMRRDMGGKFKA
ncbi:hypothetical protein NO2_1055 [Candidatus Termititenax persephonae]|uniref:Uncharacterized protein n=1 Tax=Candidatus Termititenax persephonae TaxID=2218525 RepID=A0A388TI05_9BACT|nr:hypothetical protein NO2_1055 [Candidatus Termititenax persephonae]